MKIKSQAQHRKIQELVKQGKLKQEILDGVSVHTLPERVKKPEQARKFKPIRIVK